MTIGARRRPLTVAGYDRMVEAGVLSSDDRVELIEGVIVEMASMGARHTWCCTWLIRWLVPRAEGAAVVRAGSPVRLPPDSEPEPDIALLRWRDDLYRDHPTADDVLLVIEVAETSLGRDRQRKVPLYARSGIPECWIVDLTHDVVEVHDHPGAAGYARTRTLRPGDLLTVPGVAGLDLPVADLLG